MRFLIVCLIVGASVPAFAGRAEPRESSERERLEQELETLATKNAWSGVERAYKRLVELGTTLSVSAHLLGAQSARDSGITLACLHRLKSAVRSGAGQLVEPGTPIDEAMQQLDDLEAHYGRVRIRVGGKRAPVLIRPNQPFAPDARASIDNARVELAEHRFFRGMLPTGRYILDGFEFEVAGGPNFQDITLD